MVRNYHQTKNFIEKDVEHHSCVKNLLHPISQALTQIWVETQLQYGISAFVSQKTFWEETIGGVAKCRLFSHTTSLMAHKIFPYKPYLIFQTFNAHQSPQNWLST